MKLRHVLFAVSGLGLSIVAVVIAVTLFLNDTVEVTSDRTWQPDAQSRPIQIVARGDSVMLSEQGTELVEFSLLEGSKATLTQDTDGVRVDFVGDSGEATAWFPQGDPSVVLTFRRKYRTLPRDAGSGRIKIKSTKIWGFGDAGPIEFAEPAEVRSWTFDPVARFVGPDVTATVSLTPIAAFSIAPEEHAVSWTYPRVDTDCGTHEPMQITGRLTFGAWPFYRISSSIRGRERSVAVAVTVPDSGDYAPLDAADLDRRINVLVNGHSDPSEPRYGNGGLGAAGMSATVIHSAFEGSELDGVDFVTTLASNCPTENLSVVSGDEGEGARLFSNGSSSIYVPPPKPLSSIVSGAFGKPTFDALRVYNTELAASRNPLIKEPPGPWLKPDADGGWTLSDFAVKRLADIELLGEESSLEFVSAIEAADRVRYRSWIEQRWLANGALKLNAKEYAEPGLTVVFAGDVATQSNVEMKRRSTDTSTMYWWNFTDTTEFEFPDFVRPRSVKWSTDLPPVED